MTCSESEGIVVVNENQAMQHVLAWCKNECHTNPSFQMLEGEVWVFEIVDILNQTPFRVEVNKLGEVTPRIIINVEQAEQYVLAWCKSGGQTDCHFYKMEGDLYLFDINYRDDNSFLAQVDMFGNVTRR